MRGLEFASEREVASLHTDALSTSRIVFGSFSHPKIAQSWNHSIEIEDSAGELPIEYFTIGQIAASPKSIRETVISARTRRSSEERNAMPFVPHDRANITVRSTNTAIRTYAEKYRKHVPIPNGNHDYLFERRVVDILARMTIDSNASFGSDVEDWAISYVFEDPKIPVFNEETGMLHTMTEIVTTSSGGDIEYTTPNSLPDAVTRIREGLFLVRNAIYS